MNTIQPAIQNTPPLQGNNRQKREQIAAGVGGAAGVTTTAHNMAAKKGLYTKFQQTLTRVTTTAGKVNESAKEGATLLQKFKLNAKAMTADVVKIYDKLANSKIVGAIFKNSVVRKSAGIFGGALAFFALISGVNKAAKTTVEAAGDIKHKLEVIRA